MTESSPAPVSATGPDAELIAACEAALAADADFDRLWEPWHDMPDSQIPSNVDARSKRLVARYHEMMNRAADLPATTLEGFRAKARCALTKIDLDADGIPRDADQFLVYSLCRDLAGSLARRRGAL